MYPFNKQNFKTTLVFRFLGLISAALWTPIYYLGLMAPDYFCSHFVFRSDTLTYNLRESDFSLAIPQPRTNYYKRSQCHTAVLCCGIAYPALDKRQSPSLNVFKSKLNYYDFDS